MKKKLFYVALFSNIFGALFAQQAVNTSGGMATGSGGSTAYSVGETTYSTFEGSSGTMAQGMQQPYEIQTTLGLEEAIALNMRVYPNPSVDNLYLTVGKPDLSGLSYRLYDIAGKLLRETDIDSDQTVVPMVSYTNSYYLLNIIQNQKTIKTFKIIKN